jgi:hypothetical protein
MYKRKPITSASSGNIAKFEMNSKTEYEPLQLGLQTARERERETEFLQDASFIVTLTRHRG